MKQEKKKVEKQYYWKYPLTVCGKPHHIHFNKNIQSQIELYAKILKMNRRTPGNQSIAGTIWKILIEQIKPTGENQEEFIQEAIIAKQTELTLLRKRHTPGIAIVEFIRQYFEEQEK